MVLGADLASCTHCLDWRSHSPCVHCALPLGTIKRGMYRVEGMSFRRYWYNDDELNLCRSTQEVPSLRLLLADQIAKLEEWAEEEEASSNGGGAGRTAVKGLASRVMSFAGAAEAQRSCAPKGLCSESYSCSLEGQVFRFASLR